MVKFASSYADQNEKDFESLKKAIDTDQVYAVSGV